MPAYCTESDIRHVLTTEGVDWTSFDFEIDAETVIANDIARAGTIVDQFLSSRYETAVLQASEWVKWAAAIIAARYLCTRGGNPVPVGIQAEYDRVVAFMEKVASGQMSLPGVIEQRIPGIAMSNLVVDSRYSQRKLRVVPEISVGESSSNFPRSLTETVLE